MNLDRYARASIATSCINRDKTRQRWHGTFAAPLRVLNRLRLMTEHFSPLMCKNSSLVRANVPVPKMNFSSANWTCDATHRNKAVRHKMRVQ